ncbi:hypothetical protein PPTG_20880 [Phytophthora nicotianae INRA-310]|uniref:Uncharacterized protein n=1 Tax=Phytophthora nicotianae (strain INRA-310) TaxID=761204 RepID=W2RC04_PHYN3|nr:hypothetical protein PPTG_20880 [Phytophthora nicotianae INRA-310]ETN22080.1 hypothetical protein PPTG_20880 [Phytophthora nicotianae INRA-310]
MWLPHLAKKTVYKGFMYLMPSSYSLSALDDGVTTEMTVGQYIKKHYKLRPNDKYSMSRCRNVGLMSSCE